MPISQIWSTPTEKVWRCGKIRGHGVHFFGALDWPLNPTRRGRIVRKGGLVLRPLHPPILGTPCLKLLCTFTYGPFR